MQIRLGTRASMLAQWQADWVAARLGELGSDVLLVPISTQGDRQQRGPVERIGSQGVFTKEIQRALLEDRIDLAVHSLKDLPTEPVEGLCLAAVPERASVADVLISRKYGSIDALPDGAIIGTGSLRRRTQLWHVRPDLKMLDIRGNVDTRLQKLDAGQYDAILLAEAGLQRLGLTENISQVLPLSLLLPAVGQGALGLETRTNDRSTRSSVSRLDQPDSHAAVLAERALLARLRGGCMAPVAAWARVENDRLCLDARVFSFDGKKKLESTTLGDLNEAPSIGIHTAERLIEQGAEALIQESRRES